MPKSNFLARVEGLVPVCARMPPGTAVPASLLLPTWVVVT